MSRTRFCLLALALVGCNPNDFGGTMDHAPVQLIERPDGFGDNGGRVLLPLAPPEDNPKAAARLLFAGTDKASLAVADFDGDGKPSVKVVGEDDIVALGLGAGIASMTALSGGTLVLGVPERTVVPGEPVSLGRLVFAKLAPNVEGELSVSMLSFVDGKGPVDGHLGLAVGRGTVTEAGSEEVVAVSDNSVRVLSAAGALKATSSCAGSFPTPLDLHRALAVGDFLPGGLDEIAIGMPLSGGVGRVVFLQYGVNPADPTAAPGLFCVQDKELRAPDVGVQAVSGFGVSLAAVPHKDGLADLLVGAAPDRAYLFYGAGGPPKVFSRTDALSEFGQRVLVADIDGDGLDEVGISALLANTKKTVRAGEVFFYKMNSDGVTPMAELFDSNAVANKEFFGIGLAAMKFDPNRVCGKGTPLNVPVVGADKGVFTFYRFMGGPADPRCFAQ